MSAAKNNILGQEFEYGEKGFQGELAIYASGTTGLDQNVTVKLGLDFEAIGEYNKRNFDTKFEEYAMELPAEYYTIDPMSVEMEAGSCSASLPINVRVDELLPDQTYFHSAAHRVRIVLHALGHQEFRTFPRSSAGTTTPRPRAAPTTP